MPKIHTWAMLLEDEKDTIVFSPGGKDIVVFEEEDLDGMMDFSARSGHKGDLQPLLAHARNTIEGPVALPCSPNNRSRAKGGDRAETG